MCVAACLGPTVQSSRSLRLLFSSGTRLFSLSSFKLRVWGLGFGVQGLGFRV